MAQIPGRGRPREESRAIQEPERTARAEEVATRFREMLVRAATDGRATGSIVVELRDGYVTSIGKNLRTGARDAWGFPEL